MVQWMLTSISSIVNVNAKENAPVRTWNLRRSLSTELSDLSRNMALVYSDVPYAWIRELENNLHPATKYYTIRWFTEHTREIDDAVIRKFDEFLS